MKVLLLKTCLQDVNDSFLFLIVVVLYRACYKNLKIVIILLLLKLITVIFVTYIGKNIIHT